jgi:putative FmdB family regulatory protein
MPLYEYECPRTGKRFEVIQKFSEDPVTRCPECDQHPECPGEARRLLSAPAIQFKGAGWYVTDYGKGGEKPAATAKAEGGESKSESAPETKSEKKSEAKSESKTESKSTDAKPAAKSD